MATIALLQSRLHVRQLFAASAFAAAVVCTSASAASGPAPLDVQISRATRLLVVSPHPDDGVLGGAGLIQRVLARGGTVRVAQVTSGDAFSTGVKRADRTNRPTVDDYRKYGALREREDLAAFSILGVERRDVTFLGFPDDGLCSLIARRRSAMAVAFESPYTKRSSPPERERLSADIAYRAQDVARELARVIAAFEPTVVLVPDAHDEHPDHCSTHLLVHDALAAAAARRRSRAPVVLHYLVHFTSWPAGADAHAELRLPHALEREAERWRTFPLTTRESSVKRHALHAYKSQALVIQPLLDALDRTNELFAEDDDDGQAPCWCAGENIAASPANRRRAMSSIKP